MEPSLSQTEEEASPMAAEIVVGLNVTDEERYTRYRAGMAMIAAYEARARYHPNREAPA